MTSRKGVRGELGRRIVASDKKAAKAPQKQTKAADLSREPGYEHIGQQQLSGAAGSADPRDLGGSGTPLTFVTLG